MKKRKGKRKELKQGELELPGAHAGKRRTRQRKVEKTGRDEPETETGGSAMFELMDSYSPSAVIKVIGVGGGGGNAVQHMVDSNLEGVDFICANTDAQALRNTRAKVELQLGSNVTKGLGAGANPEVGRQAALEDRERIAEVLEGGDMVFITAGMGGGTGTGAAPVVAQTAKEMGILTVAVVTRPFAFEGRRRTSVAGAGIKELAKHVDSLITIPNDKLLAVLGEEITMLNAFAKANDVLRGAVQGIAELITRPGIINVDFADVRTVMSEMGKAMMGAGSAAGEDRAVMAAEAAIGSPLLEDFDMSGARGILVNITAGKNLSMKEVHEVGRIIEEISAEDATVVLGTVIDQELSDELRVTVVATGLGNTGRRALEAEEDRPLKVVRNATTGEVDYGELSKPTVMRRKPSAPAGEASRSQEDDLDYLDIPAFLRRQAD